MISVFSTGILTCEPIYVTIIFEMGEHHTLQLPSPDGHALVRGSASRSEQQEVVDKPDPQFLQNLTLSSSGVPSVHYDIGGVRRLLRDAFTDDELWRFCQERPALQPVLTRFRRNASLEEMIDVLTQYCRAQDLFSDLLAEVESVNPRQYERHRDSLLRTGDAPVEIPGVSSSTTADSVQISVQIRDQAQVDNVSVAGRDLSQHEEEVSSPRDMSAVGGGRMLMLFAGALGLVAGLVWIIKASNGFVWPYLLALIVIVPALALGVLGLINPAWVSAVVSGRRDTDQK
jgi:hypothetical protein